MLLSMKRTGSNHLLNAIQSISDKKMVWFDAQPKFWESFGLSFGKDIWNAKIIDCFDELYDNYFGCKINWDEPSFFEIIDELIDYPVKKIILYRENIWEKVISEELAIQTNHWIAPIGRHRVYKEGYEFDEIDVDVVKNKIKDIENKGQYILNKKQEFIVLKYEDLFSRNTYTNTHKQNFKDLLIKLGVSYNNQVFENVVGDLMKPNACYKTDNTYNYIKNISELKKLR